MHMDFNYHHNIQISICFILFKVLFTTKKLFLVNPYINDLGLRESICLIKVIADCSQRILFTYYDPMVLVCNGENITNCSRI